MSFYTESQRNLQQAQESRPLAQAMEATIISDTIDDDRKAFIESRDFFFLSTVTGEGEPTVSYKGGDVGVVTVVDDKTLIFPAYDGNGMFLSMGNIDDTAKIGLLFIDFETPNRLRVQATASLSFDDPLQERYPGALFLVRATVDSVWVNCARYIHKHTRVEASPYVPDENGDQPVPAWKRIDLIQDSLHPDDRAKAADAGELITFEDYGQALAEGRS